MQAKSANTMHRAVKIARVLRPPVACIVAVCCSFVAFVVGDSLALLVSIAGAAVVAAAAMVVVCTGRGAAFKAGSVMFGLTKSNGSSPHEPPTSTVTLY